MRRPRPTAESRARAERIARSLAGLLEEDPAPEGRSALGRAGGLGCPGCGAAMTATTRGGRVEIDRCDACGSIWLDVGELELLTRAQPVTDAPEGTLAEVVARARAGLPAEDVVRYRNCPRCAALMGRRNFGEASGVIVDECPRHGVFLDPGELEAIEAFVRLGGPALARAARRSRAREREVMKPPVEVTKPALAREVTVKERLAIDVVLEVIFGLF